MDRVQILWVGRIYKGFNDGVKPHSHEFYHMLVIRSGRLQLIAGEEQRTVQTGDCILIPRGMTHSYINSDSDLNECLEIKFSIPGNVTDDKFTRYGLLQTDHPLAATLAEQIVREYSDLGPLADDAAAAYMDALLTILTADRRYRKHNAFRFIDATEYSPLSQQIIRYLEQHYSESISLDDVAQAVGYNKSYMCTAFRKDTRVTINDCLNMIRIRRAAELIAYSDNDLSQIAAMCGFSTASHFNQVFVKNVGTTPGQCRKAYPPGVTIMPERRFLDIPNRQDRFMYSVLARKQITPEMILSFEQGDCDTE